MQHVTTHHNIHPCLTSPEPRPLGKDALELLRGAAGDQGPDQGQGVRVEVGLENILLYKASLS